MKCLECKFYVKNDCVHGYGTCGPQDKDFIFDHECNLNEEEYDQINNMVQEAIKVY